MHRETPLWMSDKLPFVVLDLLLKLKRQTQGGSDQAG